MCCAYCVPHVNHHRHLWKVEQTDTQRETPQHRFQPTQDHKAAREGICSPLHGDATVLVKDMTVTRSQFFSTDQQCTNRVENFTFFLKNTEVILFFMETIEVENGLSIPAGAY